MFFFWPAFPFLSRTPSKLKSETPAKRWRAKWPERAQCLAPSTVLNQRTYYFKALFLARAAILLFLLTLSLDQSTTGLDNFCMAIAQPYTPGLTQAAARYPSCHGALTRMSVKARQLDGWPWQVARWLCAAPSFLHCAPYLTTKRKQARFHVNGTLYFSSAWHKSF